MNRYPDYTSTMPRPFTLFVEGTDGRNSFYRDYLTRNDAMRALVHAIDKPTTTRAFIMFYADLDSGRIVADSDWLK